MNRLFLLVCLFLLNLATTAYAQETVAFSFAGCTDPQGKAVRGQADPGLRVLLETHVVDGSRVIAYNPSLLPQLLPETRAFLYAHECAWTNLNLPIDSQRTLENAHKADCWAVDTLVRSHLISRNNLESIENDLALVTENAAQLPQPARQYNLASCAPGKSSKTSGNALDVNAPPASQAWNNCMQSCGNHLYACGRSSSCMATFNQCTATCKAH
jgi:hypothetical protein